MSYNDFIGYLTAPRDSDETLLKERKIPRTDLANEYDMVRYGLPTGVISFKDTESDRIKLIRHYFSQGYQTWPALKINLQLRRHVALLRASLDLWEEFCPTRSFGKEEIYVRCLSEGPAFTNYIKKARSTTLRAKTSETDTAIDEDYYVDSYAGYNSIIHERYLIHWDDTEDIDDIKYAFLEQNKPIRERRFRNMIKKMFKDFRIDEIEFEDSFDMIASLKNTKMYDPLKKKSFLMREFWTDDIDITSPYFARRVVVPTEPGSTRDTGVGDPSSILKVKQLNKLARSIHEKLPYSANAPGKLSNARYKRVLKKNAFLHLDFKKFGLTFPRPLMNIMIEEIGKVSGIDTSHLIIHNFYVEIDGEVYQTARGTMLGWLDSINCLCVSAILHWLSTEEELGFDFVTFNDDVEISKRCKSALKETLELLRMAIIAELDSFDIAISIDKTYGSRGSVFLERYAYYNRNYGLDMYKEQLTVASYAKSLVTTEVWQAKFFYSAAELWTKSEYATDRCIDTCPVEFRKEEITLPLWAGGWRIPIRGNLDYSLQETDELGYLLGLELSKFKIKKYATRRENVSSNGKICTHVNNLAWHSSSASMGSLKFEMADTMNDINIDVGLISRAVETLADIYSGRNSNFPPRIVRIVEEAIGLEDGIT